MAPTMISLRNLSKRFPGASLFRRWMIPVSVATRKRSFGDCRAKRIIPSVERMCVRPLPNAMHWLAQPHSGCTSSSASGASCCQRTMSCGRIPAWT